MSLFFPPHNWCDRLCERCRLAPICAVEQRTKDVSPDVVATLQQAAQTLEKIAAEQGIAFDLDLRPPVPSERATRLREALEEVDARTLPAVILHGKIARIADSLDDPDQHDLFLYDTVPNLFLIERLLDQLTPNTVERLRDELVPFFALIPGHLRSVFETMIEAGLAPSPFCLQIGHGGRGDLS